MEIPKSREAARGTEFEPLFDTPAHWPPHVHRLPLARFNDIGRDARTNELYWDGSALVTVKRWGTTERLIAVAGLAIAFVGVAATVVQTWVAVASLTPPL